MTQISNELWTKKFPIQNNAEITLSAINEAYIVLFFYPKDNTPGCSTESQDFRDKISEFSKYNAKIIGISRDSVTSHNKFVEKFKLNFPLISDIEEDLCNEFDVIKDKNMFGKKVRGIERSTFVLGKKGTILKEWRKVKVAGHADEVLTFISSL